MRRRPILLINRNEMGMPAGGRSGGFWSDGLRQPHPEPVHPGDAGLVRRRLAAQDPRIRILPRWLFPWRSGWSRRPDPRRVGRQGRCGVSRQRPAQGAEQPAHLRHRGDHRRHLGLREQIRKLAAEVRRPRHQPDQPGVASGQRITWRWASGRWASGRWVSGRRRIQARGARLGAWLGGGGSERPERSGGVAGGESREPGGDAAEPSADQQDQQPRYRVPDRPRGCLIQTLEDRGEAVREIGRGWRGGAAHERS